MDFVKRIVHPRTKTPQPQTSAPLLMNCFSTVFKVTYLTGHKKEMAKTDYHCTQIC